MLRRDRPKPKKFKRQLEYHSSGSDDEADQNGRANKQPPTVGPMSLEEKNPTVKPKGRVSFNKVVEVQREVFEESERQPDEESEEAEDSESEDESADDNDGPGKSRKRKKRNDPGAFATSMSKILNSKLTSSKRVDPVLSRSKEASAAVKEINESKLEAKVRQQLREEKRERLDKGRVKDVMGWDDASVSTEKIMELEKRYKKIAQRGVVRLFNAIRSAQVAGEQAALEVQRQGVVGIDQREQKVNEMSKKGFLELIAGGGAGKSKQAEKETDMEMT